MKRRKSTQTTVAQNQVSLPRVARFMMGVLTPQELKTKLDFIDDFDELYATRIVPAYGKWARWWVWMQVFKTALVMTKETVLEFRARGKKRAR